MKWFRKFLMLKSKNKCENSDDFFDELIKEFDSSTRRLNAFRSFIEKHLKDQGKRSYNEKTN